MHSKPISHIYSALAVFLIADIVVWILVFQNNVLYDELNIYALDVGQGDSGLIQFGNGPTILIDAGGLNRKARESLSQVFPLDKKYIDLLIMTHPEVDHFGGFLEILKTYEVGVFIGNGRIAESNAYPELMEMLLEKNIPYIALAENDRISHRNAFFQILHPDVNGVLSSALNDGSLVFMFTSGNFRALYTGDISSHIEERLIQKYDLSAHMLKVPHHGSKYSSSEAFLGEVNPDIAVIGVGKNSYGHPTKETLDRFLKKGVLVKRTDIDGMVHLLIDENNIQIFE